MTDRIRFPAFEDDKGNRFIFPGLNSDVVTSASERWARGVSISAALGVIRCEEDFEIGENEPFDRVVAEMGSSGLLHGSTSVWLIAGPHFDKAER